MSLHALKSLFQDGASLLCANHGVLLIAATFLLFSTSALFNVPFFLLAVLGGWQLIKAPGSLPGKPALVALSICFLCLWLPLLLSLPDAVNPARAMKTTFFYTHFFFAGVFIIQALQRPAARQKINLIVFAILSFWALDALLQFFVGSNLFGYPYAYQGQLTGMFHPKIRLGHVVAALLPFYLDFIRQHHHRYPWSWLLLAALLAVLLLSGKRVAWMMAAVGCSVYFIYFCVYCRSVRLKTLLLPGLVIVGFMAAIIWQHEPLKQRINTSLKLFSGNYELMNQATAQRLPLWETAIAVFKDNPINGVGARGYRVVFKNYAEADNFWMQNGRSGSTHPHQALLEVAAETGALGLLGFLLFWCYLIFLAITQLAHHHSFAPWLICAGIAWFPVNAHMAFYGSYWSSVGWWLLCLALAQLFHAGQNKA